MSYLCTAIRQRAQTWVFSSAGSEHLPYKQRVGGSNPSTPTQSKTDWKSPISFLFFPLHFHKPNKQKLKVACHDWRATSGYCVFCSVASQAAELLIFLIF